MNHKQWRGGLVRGRAWESTQNICSYAPQTRNPAKNITTRWGGVHLIKNRRTTHKEWRGGGGGMLSKLVVVGQVQFCLNGSIITATSCRCSHVDESALKSGCAAIKLRSRTQIRLYRSLDKAPKRPQVSFNIGTILLGSMFIKCMDHSCNYSH